MERYVQEQPRDFLAVATPGAGKTTFALTLASWLLHHHVVQQVTVVASYPHGCGAPGGVPGGVGEGFLDDAVGSHVDGLGQA